MHLNVITTLRCNFSCRHCIFACPKEGDLDPGAFRGALDGLQPHRLKSLTFTGGEPLLHPEFDAIVDAAGERGLSFGIVSNGWFHERYEPIVARHRSLFSGFNFSLDGLEETHDDVRGDGSFQRVAEAIRRFNDLGVSSTVNFVLMDGNRHELEPLVEYCVTLGVAGIKVAGFIPAVEAEGFHLSPSTREEVYQEVGLLAERYPIRIEVANSLFNPVVVEFCNVLTTNTVTLDQRGRLTLCCDIPGTASTLGEKTDLPVVQLANRARMVNEITLDRILREREGSLTPEDQSCVYCMRYFQVMA